MTRPQSLAYAIYSAKQVISLFEKKYPSDKRPRMAIEAAKAVLENDTPQNRALARKAGIKAVEAVIAASKIEKTILSTIKGPIVTTRAMAAIKAGKAAGAAAWTATGAALAKRKDIMMAVQKAWETECIAQIKILQYGLDFLKKSG